MKTAQENIAQLPVECWGILPADKSLIKITAGESGYRPIKGDKQWIEQGLKLHRVKTTDELADVLNKTSAITKAQRKAMEWGSMFGWGHGLADSDRYGEDGKPLKKMAA